MGVYKTNDPILFSIYGCVDYSYGDNVRHGQIGYRMVLGQDVSGQIFGLPFVEGAVRPYPEPTPFELLVGGNPKDPPKISEINPLGLIFRPDDGGNYAQ
jgi:hypothetical protein